MNESYIYNEEEVTHMSHIYMSHIYMSHVTHTKKRFVTHMNG